MFTEFQLLNYLFDYDFLDKKSFFNGDISILNTSRRNYNFMVLNKNNLCYLVKQDTRRGDSIRREALIYATLNAAYGNSIKNCIPRFYKYDEENNILILELYKEAKNLSEYYTLKKGFSRRIAYKIGQILSNLHKMDIENSKDLLKAPSDNLHLFNPSVETFHVSSSGTIQLFKIINQFPEFRTLIEDTLLDSKMTSLIHSDIKWDNFIVFSSSRRKIEVRVVDWELACLGDPCWDIGSIFSAYLTFWILSIPSTGESPTDQDLNLSPYPLRKIRPAINSFWNSYARNTGLNTHSRAELLLRSTKFSAIRMIVTAIEIVQNLMYVTNSSIRILQLAFNILKKPYEAQLRLLGVPL